AEGTGLLTFLEHPHHPVDVALPLVDDDLSAFGAESVQLPQKDGDVDVVLVERANIAADEACEALLRPPVRRLALGGPPPRPAELPENDLVEEIVLGLDVVVEAALEQAELLGDVLERGRVVAAVVEHARGDGDQLLLAVPPDAGLADGLARLDARARGGLG